MRTRSILFGGAALGALIALSSGASADAATKKHHAKPAAVSETQKEIDELEAKVQFLTDRLDEQAAVTRDAQNQLKAAQAQAAQANVAAAQANATASAEIQTIPTQVQTAVAANKPKTDKLYYKGVTVTLGGFLAAESIYRSHDETADIASAFQKIPFPNDPAGRTDETHLTARQSRVTALVQGDPTPGTHAAFYGEMDFLGAAQTANSNESDSYNPRMRVMYGEFNTDSGWHLLAGQNWSLVTMNSKGITPRNELTPPQIDAQYVPGFAWARQPQLRLTHDFFDKQLWVAVSAENPQTTLGNTKTVTGVSVTDNQAPATGYFSGVTGVSAATTATATTVGTTTSVAATTTVTTTTNPYSLNQYPDVVAKVAYEPKIQDHTLHLEAFAIARDFYDRVNVSASNTIGLVTGPSNKSTWGGGFGGGATFDLVPKLLDVQVSAMTGQGIGRYGSSQLPDATIKPNGELVGIPETMFLAGATLHPIKPLDVYVFGGQEAESNKTYKVGATTYGTGDLAVASNAGCAVESGSCSPYTKSVNQITAGFWDRFYQGPFGRMQVGVQYSYTQRTAFGDATGFGPKTTENMLFTSFRYYPF
jgi:cell division septation protein DedD